MPSEPDIGLAEARQLAADLFVVGFPLVLMDVVRRAHPIELNRLLQLTDDSAALAPGLTDEGLRTVRTSAWIDVSEGPVVVHLPHMHGRYFSLTLIDTWGEPFASLGSRTGDDVGCDLALAGPRWRGELVGALKARRSAGDMVWAISRITANSGADREEAEALAARQWLAPLRKGGGPAPIRRLDPPASACAQQVMDMSPETFSHRLNLLIERTSRDFQDPAARLVRTQLRTLNDLSRASDPDTARALARGFADGAAAIRAAASFASDPIVGGWRMLSPPAQSAGGDALARAVRAYVDLGGPAPDDVLSLVCDLDEAGRDLSGAERYRIHFPRGATPPVEAFWSLFVVARSAKGAAAGPRRGISDRNDLAPNPDGSLDLIIQRDQPGGAQATNWLPAPAGDFRLTMRLHWPKPPALNGAWRMPAVERLGSGFARRAETRGSPTDRPPPYPPDDLSPAHSPWR